MASDLRASRRCARLMLGMQTNVRCATPEDWLAVKTLIYGARHSMPDLWWWEEYLGDELFVVSQGGAGLVGAFLACPDASPVAWVRIAALEDGMEVVPWLQQVLPIALAALRRRQAQILAWLDYRGWASPHLAAVGFRRLTDVVTMIKTDRHLPLPRWSDITLRPATQADVPAVVAVDRAAFAPHWWNSAATLRRRYARSSCFAVAEQGGEIIGYAEAERRSSSAHINRIAVLPAHQGGGVGSALLAYALRRLWHAGAEHITLNTQTDNVASLRLYRRFGFEPLGERIAAWERPTDDASALSAPP